MDRHRFVADSDTTFHFDADPVPDSTPGFTVLDSGHMLEIQIFSCIPSNASLQGFILSVP